MDGERLYGWYVRAGDVPENRAKERKESRMMTQVLNRTVCPLILNLSYLHLPKVAFQFHNHHAFLWIWRWGGHVDAREKLAEQSHCQTGEFPQEIIKGSLSASTHAHLSPGFLSHTARALAVGSHRTLILLWGSSSRLVTPASSFPGLPLPCSATLTIYPFGIHHILYICNLWARWSFKEQTHLQCPWIKSIFNLTNVVVTV